MTKILYPTGDHTDFLLNRKITDQPSATPERAGNISKFRIANYSFENRPKLLMPIFFVVENHGNFCTKKAWEKIKLLNLFWCDPKIRLLLPYFASKMGGFFGEITVFCKHALGTKFLSKAENVFCTVLRDGMLVPHSP